MEKVEMVIEGLLKKAFVLLIISFVGVLLVVRGELLGEKAVVYAFGGVVGMSSAIFAALICFFILGLKAGRKTNEKEMNEIKKLGIRVSCKGEYIKICIVAGIFLIICFFWVDTSMCVLKSLYASITWI